MLRWSFFSRQLCCLHKEIQFTTIRQRSNPANGISETPRINGLGRGIIPRAWWKLLVFRYLFDIPSPDQIKELSKNNQCFIFCEGSWVPIIFQMLCCECFLSNAAKMFVFSDVTPKNKGNVGSHGIFTNFWTAPNTQQPSHGKRLMSCGCESLPQMDPRNFWTKITPKKPSWARFPKGHVGYPAVQFKGCMSKVQKPFSSWWLNQPSWKICSSNWVHLPQVSGWKTSKIIELPPPGSDISVYWLLHGCFRKQWYHQNTPKWSFLVGKPMVVGYHHLRKHPHDGSLFLAWVQSQFWTLLCFSLTVDILEQPDVEVAFEKPNLALFKKQISDTVDGSEIPNNHLGCIKA